MQVALVWIGCPGQLECKYLDNRKVRAITTSLEAGFCVDGYPRKLAKNDEKSFKGSEPNGKGFVLKEEECSALMQSDPDSAEVIFPYLVGDDINSSPTSSASRRAIYFGDREIDEICQYEKCLVHLRSTVKKEREDRGSALSESWWKFKRPTPDLYDAISDLERVLAISLVSKTCMPTWQSTGQVFSNLVGIFAFDDYAHFAVLSSSQHYWWAIRNSGDMRVDLRYSPSEVFETLAMPTMSDRLSVAGEELDEFRNPLMSSRSTGLTGLYNLVHDQNCQDEDIRRLREIHINVDEAVKEAYAADEENDPGIRIWERRETGESHVLPAWRDLDLDHGFHDTPQGVRFTIGPQARVDVLDKLLSLNHYRWQQEEERGEHKKKPAKRRKKTSPAASRTPSQSSDPVDGALFEPPDTLF